MRTNIDPKRAWAARYLRYAQVELMVASRKQLMRVPGIGPVGGDAIIRARRQGRLTELAHLTAGTSTGCQLSDVRPFF